MKKYLRLGSKSTHSGTISKIAGFSMGEILGAVAVVMVLALLAIPSYRSLNTGAKQSVVTRNAETLNSAVQQYDQAGGLMTAEVTVPANVASIKNTKQLPEMRVLNLLRDAEKTSSGELVSSWQEPIFSDEGYRAVWRNGFTDAQAAQSSDTLSGLRNPAAEALIANGQGGQFVVLAPGEEPGRLGIVGFNDAALTPEAATPTPTPPALQNFTVNLSLSDPSAGTISGSGSYTEGSIVNVNVALNPGWVAKAWDASMASRLGSLNTTTGSFAVTGPVNGALTVERADVQVTLQVNPVSAGAVTGSGSYKYGDNVPYRVTPNPGWTFKSWNRAGMSGATGTIQNINSDITATATMELMSYIMTMQSGVGGTANLAPGSYTYGYNDNIPLVATPIWNPDWDAQRYRWSHWTVGTGSNMSQNYTHVMLEPVVIRPNFVRQYIFNATPNNGAWGQVNASATGYVDENTQIQLSATPADIYHAFKQWEASYDNGATWNVIATNTNTTVTVTRDMLVRGIFIDKYTVNINVINQSGQPAAGAVSITGAAAGINEMGINSNQTIVVRPVQGWGIVQISGATTTPLAGGLLNVGGTINFQVSNNMTITVIVGQVYNLTVTAMDANTERPITGAGISGTGTFLAGAQSLNVTGIPAGYEFLGWYRDNTVTGQPVPNPKYSLLSSSRAMSHNLSVDSRLIAMFAQPLSASITASPNTLFRGQTTTLTSTVNIPSFITRTYTYSGDISGTSTGGTHQASFTTVGQKTVTVTIRDSAGRTTTASVQIAVNNRAPSVTLSAPPTVYVGTPFLLTASATDADGDTLTYTFTVPNSPQNGSSSSSPTLNATIQSRGQQTVSVTVTDQFGGSATASAPVNALRLFTATAVANPSSYGWTTGSGQYVEGSMAGFGAGEYYGYQFTGWNTYGAVNPLWITMDSDKYLVANYTRRSFLVTLRVTTSTWGERQYSGASASLYNASTGAYLGGTSSASRFQQNSSEISVWVPYGDVVYFNGSVTVHSDHVTAFWPGGYADPKFGSEQWYSNSWSGLGFTQVTGNVTLELGAFTPLLVDISKDKVPDLLSGTDWKYSPERAPSPNKNAYREFDMDGKGASAWEWVGPTDGLLVWMENLGEVPTGKNLFGGATWGKQWKNGFEPLKTLDIDKDAKLSNDELEGIGIWIDANSDAKVQSGEVKPLSEHDIVELKLDFSEDTEGNTHHKSGAADKSGKAMAVWDWISYKYPSFGPDNEIARIDWSNKEPNSEHFKLDIGEGMEKLPMAPGGTLRVYKSGSKYFVRVTNELRNEEPVDGKPRVFDFVFPATFENGVLSWGIKELGIANTLVASGPELFGLTLEGGKRYATWTAWIESGAMPNE